MPSSEEQNPTPVAAKPYPQEGQEKSTPDSFYYSGPLPPASEYERYENAVPGSGDRILHMAEEEGSDRRRRQRSLDLFQFILAGSSRVMAFLLMGGGMFIGYTLIMEDKSTEGLVALITPLAVAAGAIIWRHFHKPKENK